MDGDPTRPTPSPEAGGKVLIDGYEVMIMQNIVTNNIGGNQGMDSGPSAKSERRGAWRAEKPVYQRHVVANIQLT